MCLLFTVTKLTKVMLHPWHNYALSLSSCPLDPPLMSSGSEHSEVLYPRVQVYPLLTNRTIEPLSSIKYCIWTSCSRRFWIWRYIKYEEYGWPLINWNAIHVHRSFDIRQTNEKRTNEKCWSRIGFKFNSYMCIRSQDYMYDRKIN